MWTLAYSWTTPRVAERVVPVGEAAPFCASTGAAICICVCSPSFNLKREEKGGGGFDAVRSPGSKIGHLSASVDHGTVRREFGSGPDVVQGQ